MIRPFDIPDRGYDAAFSPDAGEQPAGAIIFGPFCSDGCEVSNGPRFADFDFTIHDTDTSPKGAHDNVA